MNLKRLVPISLIALNLNFITPVAQAEELWALYYNGVNYGTLVCTVDVCGPSGSFSTNPATMAQVSTSYGCPSVCTFLHLDYNTRQPDGKTSTERVTSTPTPTPTPTTAPITTETATTTTAPTTTATTAPTTVINCQISSNSANSTCREVTGIQTSLINLGTNYFDFGICINATSNYIYYTNISYAWSVAGPLGVVSSGISGAGLIASGTCESQNNIQTVRVDNLLQNASYTISSSITNAGKNHGSSMTVSTKGGSATTADTKTVTTQADTKTVTTQSETRTTEVAVVAAISNIDSRTVTAANLLRTYSATEKENLLNVTLKSAKSAVINVASDIPDIKMIITATKKGSKPIVFNIKTNSEGDGQIKTSKNLTGYTIILSANGVKLDSDKAIKK